MRRNLTVSATYFRQLSDTSIRKRKREFGNGSFPSEPPRIRGGTRHVSRGDFNFDVFQRHFCKGREASVKEYRGGGRGGGGAGGGGGNRQLAYMPPVAPRECGRLALSL